MKQSVLTKIKSLQVTDLKVRIKFIFFIKKYYSLKMQEEVASVMLAISFFMEITQTYSKPTGDKDRIPNFVRNFTLYKYYFIVITDYSSICENY